MTDWLETFEGNALYKQRRHHRARLRRRFSG
jgi:hypothetical protein